MSTELTIDNSVAVREALRSQRILPNIALIHSALKALRSDYAKALGDQLVRSDVAPKPTSFPFSPEGQSMGEVLKALHDAYPDNKQVKKLCERFNEGELSGRVSMNNAHKDVSPEQIYDVLESLNILKEDKERLTTEKISEMSRFLTGDNLPSSYLTRAWNFLIDAQEALNDGDIITPETSKLVLQGIEACERLTHPLYQTIEGFGPLKEAIVEFAKPERWAERSIDLGYQEYLKIGYAAYLSNRPKPVEKKSAWTMSPRTKNLATAVGLLGVGFIGGRMSVDSPEQPEPPAAVAPDEVYDRLDPYSTLRRENPASRTILEEGPQKPAQRGDGNSAMGGVGTP